MEASVASIVASGVASRSVSRSEHATKMLVKADARFLGDAGGIGIQSVKKTLNLLPNLRPSKKDWRTARCGALPWLGRVVHSPLYPACPQRN
jgi:hypothetical protein